MLSVFICEDNQAQRTQLETIINNFIMIEEFDMSIALSTSNPDEIIAYLNNHGDVRGVYFLDVDLQHTINGIQLGSFIREKDLDGKIIFITTHSELLHLTFTYKVEALDYIIKEDTDELKKRIFEALQQAQKHYKVDATTAKNRITLKIGNQVRVFALEDILFIETSSVPHKLILHTLNSSLDFYGKITEMEELAPDLLRVHKSYVVNIANIQSFDKRKRELIMCNGEVCLLSIRQLKKLEQLL